MKVAAFTAALFVAMTATAFDAQADGRLSGWRQNGAGGISAGTIHNWTGPNGGQLFGGRGFATDGQGGGVFGSRGCATGNGGWACRAGGTAFDGNGNVTHGSGFAAQGPNGGWIASQGGFTRNAAGGWAGGRTTTLSGANGSYVGSSSYSSDGGYVHTGTCYDVAGNVVACPRR
ncbi:MAG: hypothetical protein R3F55_14575 [Alphaproteobacteria bacterium]